MKDKLRYFLVSSICITWCIQATEFSYEKAVQIYRDESKSRETYIALKDSIDQHKRNLAATKV